MKQQWSLILGFFFALVVAVFSVLNVESVPVDYAFGTASFPLIIVILASALAGGLVPSDCSARFAACVNPATFASSRRSSRR